MDSLLKILYFAETYVNYTYLIYDIYYKIYFNSLKVQSYIKANSVFDFFCIFTDLNLKMI